MQPNPLLKKLGLSATDRVVIFHADDIGMCQATVSAYADLVDFGLLSSAAVMMPCPWSNAVGDYCREHQDSVDMGAHLTLTSEWSAYRWGPLSTRSQETGFVDDGGMFFPRESHAQEHGDPDAVYVELKAQVERALAIGIDLTHVDSHMGTLFHPRLLAAYQRIAQEYRLPALMLRPHEALKNAFGLGESLWDLAQMAEAAGLPMMDAITLMSLNMHEERVAEAKTRLDQLPAGVSYFIIHPAKDTPELRALAPDWQARVADYELFVNEEWRRIVADSGIHVMGYRAIRDAIRA
jgi:predicted glycoside hydrolase/deacetylase ChbG (UPF0249 family)